jgi:HK97 gp10 family phage protein
MAEVKVDVIGVQEIMDALAELPEEVQKEVLDGILEEAALMLEAEAKRLAPYRTGKLRDSIEARKVKPRRGEVARWLIGPKGVKYASYVEFGSAHNPPQPYMRPTHDGKKAEVINDARDEIIAGVERLAEEKG